MKHKMLHLLWFPLAIFALCACGCLSRPQASCEAHEKEMTDTGIRRSQIQPDWPTLRTTEALLKGVYLPPMQIHTNLASAIDMLDRYLQSRCPPDRTVRFTVAKDARSQQIFITFYSLSAYDFLCVCQATTDACFSITDAAVAIQMKRKKD